MEKFLLGFLWPRLFPSLNQRGGGGVCVVFTSANAEGTGEHRLSKIDVTEDESLHSCQEHHLIMHPPPDCPELTYGHRFHPLLPEPCPHWPFPQPSFTCKFKVQLSLMYDTL